MQYRRYWLPDLFIVLGLMALTTWLFWTNDWDNRFTAQFYDEAVHNLWPHERDTFWRIWYHAAPVMTALLAISGIALFIGSFYREGLRKWRIHGLFFFLCVGIGPGVVVNMIFKQNWGRPRPEHTVIFGGDQEYVKPGMLNDYERGRSFPSGHSSVAFVYCALYFYFRRHKPALAFTALGLSLLFGLMVGGARIVAGKHYLSDVLWSGYMVFFVCLALYYFVLKVPSREDRLLGKSV